MAAIGAFQPSVVKIERTIVSKAPDSTLFNLVNNINDWNKWSAWHRIDPANTQWVYSDNAVGSGAWYSWKSPNWQVGEGRLEIVKSIPNTVIETTMTFGEDPKPSKSEFFFSPVPEGIKVTMTMESDLGGNPWTKFGGILMKHFVEKDYDACLKNLDSTAVAMQQ